MRELTSLVQARTLMLARTAARCLRHPHLGPSQHSALISSPHATVTCPVCMRPLSTSTLTSPGLDTGIPRAKGFSPGQIIFHLGLGGCSASLVFLLFQLFLLFVLFSSLDKTFIGRYDCLFYFMFLFVIIFVYSKQAFLEQRALAWIDYFFRWPREMQCQFFFFFLFFLPFFVVCFLGRLISGQNI